MIQGTCLRMDWKWRTNRQPPTDDGKAYIATAIRNGFHLGSRAAAEDRASNWKAAPPPKAEWREPILPSIQIKVEGVPSDSQ